MFRKSILLAEAEITKRARFSVRLGRDLRLADLTSRRALQFGVTASVDADERNHASHAFAVGAMIAGFDGVRYLARHDPAQKLYSVALFADAGAPDPADPDWPPGTRDPTPADLVAEGARVFGYRVMPTP